MTENDSVPSLFSMSVAALCRDGEAYTKAFDSIPKNAKGDAHQIACKFYADKSMMVIAGHIELDDDFRTNIVMMRRAWKIRNYAFLETEMNLRQKLHVLDETSLYIKIATWSHYHQYEQCIRIRNQGVFTVAARVAFETKNSEFAKRIWKAVLQVIEKNSSEVNFTGIVETFGILLSGFVVDAIEHNEWSTLYNYARSIPSDYKSACITKLCLLNQLYFYDRKSPLRQQSADIVYAKMCAFHSFVARIFSHTIEFVHRDVFTKQWLC
ncbi:MAG TPA: hypothetical protein VI821_00455 [Candidatus Paceibacterota bacterium]